MISVIDNYLDEANFEMLEAAFTSPSVAWYYNSYAPNKYEKNIKVIFTLTIHFLNKMK